MKLENLLFINKFCYDTYEVEFHISYENKYITYHICSSYVDSLSIRTSNRFYSYHMIN